MGWVNRRSVEHPRLDHADQAGQREGDEEIDDGDGGEELHWPRGTAGNVLADEHQVGDADGGDQSALLE